MLKNLVFLLLVSVTSWSVKCTAHNTIFEAIQNRSLDGMQQFLGNLDALDIGGNSPLLLACSTGFVEGVEMLLENGFDIKARNARGETCLHLAGLVKKL